MFAEAVTWDLTVSLINATVQLDQPQGDGTRTVGTGFLIDAPRADGTPRVVLVTAGHVVERMPAQDMRIGWRVPLSDGSWRFTPAPLTIRDGEGEPLWVSHPDHDVAVMSIEAPEAFARAAIPIGWLADGYKGTLQAVMLGMLVLALLGWRWSYGWRWESIPAALAVMWRPLAFASADPDVAQARGVPVRTLSFAFMLVLGLAVALSVQIVGALLVLSLVVTPAAAAARVTASPVLLPVLSVLFAVVSIEGGILLALGGSIPISPYVTTISFTVYAVCRVAGRYRNRRWGARRTAVRAA